MMLVKIRIVDCKSQSYTIGNLKQNEEERTYLWERFQEKEPGIQKIVSERSVKEGSE